MLPHGTTAVAGRDSPLAAPPLDPGGSGADPAAILAGWLAVTAAGDDLQPRLLRTSDGRLMPLPVARWAGPVDDGDRSLLARVRGPVLDVGCGPGRLTAWLHTHGHDVLGLDVSAELPVRARAARAPLHIGDVFAPVPRAGSWSELLLADGNVGIGGEPVRLLRRARALLAPAGRVLLELVPGPSGPVRLEGLGITSSWFAWGLLGSRDLVATASAADLRVQETWSDSGRDFASLERCS